MNSSKFTLKKKKRGCKGQDRKNSLCLLIFTHCLMASEASTKTVLANHFLNVYFIQT